MSGDAVPAFLKRTTIAVAALGGLVGPACLLAFGAVETWTATDLREVRVLLPVLLWSASPFAALVLAGVLSRTRPAAGAVLALALVAALIGVAVYGDAVRRRSFVLLLLFTGIPFLQWGLAAAALVAAAVLGRRRPVAAR